MDTEALKIPMAAMLDAVSRSLREAAERTELAAADLESHSIFAAAGGVIVLEEQLRDITAMVQSLRVLGKMAQR